jgi:hypothetical protein
MSSKEGKLLLVWVIMFNKQWLQVQCEPVELMRDLKLSLTKEFVSLLAAYI